MGQLERYGLYVLCLVIFLILGVAIWADPEPKNDEGRSGKMHASVELNTSGPVGGAAAGEGVLAGTTLSEDERLLREAEDFLRRKQLPSQPGADQDAGSAAQPAPANFGPAILGGAHAALPVAPGPQQVPPPSDGGPGNAGKGSAGHGSSVIRSHKVQKGDRLEEIARKYLGRRSAWRLIHELNPDVDPGNLKIGAVLRIPAAGRLLPKTDARPAEFAGKSVKVRPGDSLAKISMRVYRTESHAAAIRKLNNLDESAVIHPGQILKLPELEVVKR